MPEPIIPANVSDAQLRQILIDGQTAIFKELKELRKTVEDVALQKKDIEYITAKLSQLEKDKVELERERKQEKAALERELTDLKTTCLKRHAAEDQEATKPKEKSYLVKLLQATGIAMACAAGVAFMSLIAFILYDNIDDLHKYQGTQYNADDTKKH